jgi:hypothetical protein
MAVTTTDDIDAMESFVPREIEPKPFRPEDIDPARVVVSFDRQSGTLIIHLFGRDRETISVPVANYLSVLVDADTEMVIGLHIEGFLAQAAKDIPEVVNLLDYAELRGITPAEVRELQRDTLSTRQQPLAHSRDAASKSVQDRRRQAISALIDAGRTRWNLQFLPAVG